MSTLPAPASQPPTWRHCRYGTDPATDPVGCRGIHIPGHNSCLAHLTKADRAVYLADLASGADIDLRGTPFVPALLDALLKALRSTTERPLFGDAQFDEATFTGGAGFGRATFTGDARFDGATFTGTAGFGGATFLGIALFHGVTFTGDAAFTRATFTDTTDFGGATFTGDARFKGAKFTDTTTTAFDEATFTGDAQFGAATFTGAAGFTRATFTGDAQFYGATFTGDARFGRATFTGEAGFNLANFTGDAQFDGATFTVTPSFGPLVCVRQVDLSGAVFGAPVAIEIAASAVRCVRTRWESTATLRLRYATVNLTDAVLSSPVAVTAHPSPFTTSARTVDESMLIAPGFDPSVRVTSVQGVDAAHLVLTDTDLTTCLFSGAFHLDQLQLEGRCSFARTPIGLHVRLHWYKIWLYRWSRRRTLAEEHHWRAEEAGNRNPAPARGWYARTGLDDFGRAPEPESLAATYRQLRKAFEDRKNGPGAADFYYGEMEIRRHDKTGTPRVERILLSGYWLLSGYGLRAMRALGWLLATMVLTVGLLMAFGLPPAPGPTQQSTLTVRPTGLSTAPVGPSGAAPGDWLTLPRLDRATRTAFNSVVFRSAGEGLTSVGTYIEMVSRFLEPILLVLALLAVRNRVKR
ncbi:pentapeptide repeat-containing protein [Streptomyces olivochromogenes]|uniref:pentapeptide repeat-containing protein n=1 Tax=Streptomyces olivochromogenes TaxID=1963 RepID=UPI0036DAAC34